MESEMKTITGPQVIHHDFCPRLKSKSDHSIPGGGVRWSSYSSPIFFPFGHYVDLIMLFWHHPVRILYLVKHYMNLCFLTQRTSFACSWKFSYKLCFWRLTEISQCIYNNIKIAVVFKMAENKRHFSFIFRRIFWLNTYYFNIIKLSRR